MIQRIRKKEKRPTFTEESGTLKVKAILKPKQRKFINNSLRANPSLEFNEAFWKAFTKQFAAVAMNDNDFRISQ